MDFANCCSVCHGVAGSSNAMGDDASRKPLDCRDTALSPFRRTRSSGGRTEPSVEPERGDGEGTGVPLSLAPPVNIAPTNAYGSQLRPLRR